MANIIKFNTTYLDKDNADLMSAIISMYKTNPGNSWTIFEYMTWYNTYLAGQYAYLIHMRYIVPLQNISNFYIKAEQDISMILNKEYIKNNEAWYNGDCLKKDELHPYEYIDILGFVGKYLFKNFVESDVFENMEDISIYLTENSLVQSWGNVASNAKVFRTWLAQTLIELDQDSDGNNKLLYYNSTVLNMLNYYANEMYDSTVEICNVILEYANTSSVSSVESSCGCNNTSSLSNLYITDNTYDFESIYSNAMYNIMYETFTNTPEFWSQFSTFFLTTFKNIIGYIIDAGWTITCDTTITQSNPYYDCNCTSDTSSAQTCILQNLLIALNYLISGEDSICGHKNFIYQAFTAFAEIYPCMYWG